MHGFQFFCGAHDGLFVPLVVLLGKHLCMLIQVDAAYLEYGPDHNIVAFMQSLGYSDFTAASPDEEKMTQFKRALKLTRPAFAATRSPMQQVPFSLPRS